MAWMCAHGGGDLKSRLRTDDEYEDTVRWGKRRTGGMFLSG